MSIFCDRCGAQLKTEKENINFESLEKQVLPIEIENPYGKDHESEIRNAYFLSNIRKEYKGKKLKYINQYIDYVLIRTYYEKNKRSLMTKDFRKDKAHDLLTSLTEMKLNKGVLDLLEEEYQEDYQNKKIPKHILNKVLKVYIPEFDLKKLNQSKKFTKTIGNVIKSTIKTAIVFGIILGIVYAGLTVGMPTLIDTIMEVPYILYAVIGIVGFIGITKGSKKGNDFPYQDAISSNSVFKKHIMTEGKKRLKTLKYRMKKGKD